MADSLYRSHNLERTQNSDGITTSGSITLWEDNPNSPYDVNDTFQPVPNGPILTVNKVSINDNVIGEKNGKVLRQWQITVEGSTDIQNVTGQDVQIKYDFEIDTDDNGDIFHSGTMQVVNSGNKPVFAIEMGKTFNVPGIGNVKCTKIRGSDNYDDKGIHTWTVIYEGNDKKENSNDNETRTKYNFAVEKNNDGDVIYSGSKQVINEGDAPSIVVPIGSNLSIPGAGNIKCTKFSGNDEYTSDGKRRWIVTYEGTNEKTSSDNGTANTKYSYSIEKDSDGNVVKSGSKQVTLKGDNPVTEIQVGKSFNVPGVGNVTCVKVSANDEYTDNGVRRWVVTYEGKNSTNSSSFEADTKYSFSIKKTGENKNSNVKTLKSGTKQVTYKNNPPSLGVDGNINIPNLGSIPCVGISVNDEYDNNGKHLWIVTYEGSNENELKQDEQEKNYPKETFSITKDSNGNIVRSTSKQELSSSTPNSTIPGTVSAGGVSAKGVKVSGSSEYNSDGEKQWIVTYEGSESEEESEPSYSYSFSKDSDGIKHYSGTKEFTKKANENIASLGDSLNIPGAGQLTITNIRVNGNRITYEGTRTGNSESDDDSSQYELPENEETVSYELNGTTTRSVSGELIVLTRSSTPMTKKSITVYTESDNRIGSSYAQEGVVLSETISKEVIKEDGEVKKTYYRHEIEVEE